MVKFIQRTSPLGKCVVRRTGPYRVISRVSDSNYQLANTDGTPIDGHTHVRWLAPYFMPPGGIPSHDVDISGAPASDLEFESPSADEPVVRAEPQPLGVEPPPPAQPAIGSEPQPIGVESSSGAMPAARVESQPHEMDMHAQIPADLVQDRSAAPGREAALPEPRPAGSSQSVPMKSDRVSKWGSVPSRSSARLREKKQAQERASSAGRDSAG